MFAVVTTITMSTTGNNKNRQNTGKTHDKHQINAEKHETRTVLHHQRGKSITLIGRPINIAFEWGLRLPSAMDHSVTRRRTRFHRTRNAAAAERVPGIRDQNITGAENSAQFLIRILLRHWVSCTTWFVFPSLRLEWRKQWKFLIQVQRRNIVLQITHGTEILARVSSNEYSRSVTILVSFGT